MKNKKQILIYVAIAVAFFVIGGIVGSKMENNRINKAITQVSSETSVKDSDESVQKEDSSKVSFVKMNEIEKFQGIDMRVLNVKESENINNESGKTKASGKFIIIELSLKNTSKEAVQYGADQFQLINNGAKYQIDDNAFDSMGNLNSQKVIYDENKDYIGVFDKFNPGMTKKTYIVFEVPKEIKLEESKLIVSNNEDIQFELTK